VKTINLFCAGNKVFVNIQAQGGGLTPTPPCVRPCRQYSYGFLLNKNSFNEKRFEKV